MEKNIRRIGSTCRVDEQGYIMNDSSLHNVGSHFKKAIMFFKDVTLENFRCEIHSIYIRGSVPRGLGIEGVSDLDVILVTDSHPEKLDGRLLEDIEKRVVAAYPFVNGVEMSCFHVDVMLETSRFAMIPFMIKTHSICVYGENLQNKLPSYKADKALANEHIYHLEDLIHQAKRELEGNDDREDVKDCCVWIMKIIVRCGLAFVIQKEETYTRDLYPAYELFLKYYPEKEIEMREALNYAVDPSEDPEEIRSFLSEFGGWMIAEADNWLEVHNAAGEEHLKLES